MEGNGLQSFLILPVQRMPRYEMLLKELYKDTSASHPDHTPLATAIEGIVQINIYLNEKKKQAESNQRLLDLAQDLSGKLAHELVRPNMHLRHDEEVCES
jgi:FYVE/RhoGEF/PH domain-containing protein 5/6